MLKAAVRSQQKGFGMSCKTKTIYPRTALRYAIEKMPELKTSDDEIIKIQPKQIYTKEAAAIEAASFIDDCLIFPVTKSFLFLLAGLFSPFLS